VAASEGGVGRRGGGENAYARPSVGNGKRLIFVCASKETKPAKFSFLYLLKNFPRVSYHLLLNDFLKILRVLYRYQATSRWVGCRAVSRSNPHKRESINLRYLLDKIRTFFDENSDCEF